MAPIPSGTLAAWRAQARAVLADLAAPVERRRLAWRFLLQWGLR